MAMSTQWIKTSRDVYFAIYSEHRKNLVAFAAFTSSGDGDPLSAHPAHMTEWGFKGADAPIIKCDGKKEDRHQQVYDWEYFIACNTEDEEG